MLWGGAGDGVDGAVAEQSCGCGHGLSDSLAFLAIISRYPFYLFWSGDCHAAIAGEKDFSSVWAVWKA